MTTEAKREAIAPGVVLADMLDKRRKWLASCERTIELLRPEWERFEAREGHDVYVARLYADHTSEARTHRKEIEALEAVIMALAEPQVSDDTVRVGSRELRIGDKVEVTGEYEADWRGADTWVAGIRVHDSGEGLDITLSEQWPIPNRHWREYRGQTDGFRPEELRLLTAATASEPQALSEERAREVLRSHGISATSTRDEIVRAMIRFATETQKGCGE